ncbi:MAG: TSUP family transporter, partial [Candidatus Phosphoribacter baldrii]
MPWIAVPLGLVTGAVMGALGGGGAILTIPVLIYVLGMPPHDATTASLVIVGVSAASTAVSHVRGGTARLLDAVVLAVVGIVGTYAGCEPQRVSRCS